MFDSICARFRYFNEFKIISNQVHFNYVHSLISRSYARFAHYKNVESDPKSLLSIEFQLCSAADVVEYWRK